MRSPKIPSCRVVSWRARVPLALSVLPWSLSLLPSELVDPPSEQLVVPPSERVAVFQALEPTLSAGAGAGLTVQALLRRHRLGWFSKGGGGSGTATVKTVGRNPSSEGRPPWRQGVTPSDALINEFIPPSVGGIEWLRPRLFQRE